jgi:hypothetical protein
MRLLDVNTDDIDTERLAQTRRIEKIVAGLLAPDTYLITFVYSGEGIMFRIDDLRGQILAEAYRETLASEIKGMSDEEIESRLKSLFANTHQFLNY